MLQAEQKRADALRRGVTSSTCERLHLVHCTARPALLSAWLRRTLFPNLNLALHDPGNLGGPGASGRGTK